MDDPELALHEALQSLAPARVAQLAQRLRLDLSYALARDGELLPDLFQRVIGLFADGRLEGDRLFRDLQNLAHLVERDLHLRRNLLGRRLPADLLNQVARGAD